MLALLGLRAYALAAIFGGAGPADDGTAELRLLGIEQAVEAVFGSPEAMDRARRLKPGDRGWVDRDRDGDPDVLIMRDAQAVIVVLDDDDDMFPQNPEPDQDSDCWVVDLDADGRPDRVLDNIDHDGDGDVDETQHYYLGKGMLEPGVRLFVAWDYNDNNQLWRLRRYSYDQVSCQWDCDFGAGGDEGFSMFRCDPSSGEWEPCFECPFLFYDTDGDGRSEEALRFEGRGSVMQSVRYSLNADNDMDATQPYDYDLAVIALGPVELPAASLVTTRLRVGRTGGHLSHSAARQVARSQPWRRVLLVFDENDCNIDPRDPGRHERWEGIINAPYGDFPQVGGPNCGTLNKRYECDADASGALRLYLSPIDKRLHLYGAERGTYTMDRDGDGRADRVFTYRDADGDGFIDTFGTDEGADGVIDRESSMGAGQCSAPLLPLDSAKVTAAYLPALRAVVREQERAARALGIALPAPDAGLERRRFLAETAM